MRKIKDKLEDKIKSLKVLGLVWNLFKSKLDLINYWRVVFKFWIQNICLVIRPRPELLSKQLNESLFQVLSNLGCLEFLKIHENNCRRKWEWIEVFEESYSRSSAKSDNFNL